MSCLTLCTSVMTPVQPVYFYIPESKTSKPFTPIIKEVAKCDYKSRHICPSVCLSSKKNATPTRRIFVEFHIWDCHWKLSIRSYFFKSGRNKRRLHLHQRRHVKKSEDWSISLVSRCSTYRQGENSPFTRYVQKVRHLDVGERITRNRARDTEIGETSVDLNTL